MAAANPIANKCNTVFNDLLRWRVFLLFMFSVVWNVQAQDYYTGLKFDDEQYASEFRMARGLNFTELDTVESVSLDGYAPEAGNQGKFNSCVSWATAYAALTIHQHIAGNPVAPRSPWYVYNQVNNPLDCNAPTSIGNSLKVLKEKGDCSFSDFMPPTCGTPPSDTLHTYASRCRIKDYYTIFSSEDAADVKIQNTIHNLSSKKCVIVGMKMFKNFTEVGKDGMYKPKEESGELGGHAMCVTGFDKKKKVFRLLNSWGTGWGDRGYCTLSFDDFARYTRYAYCMNIITSSSLNFADGGNQLEGEFIFKKLYVRGSDYVFEEVQPVLQDRYYTLNQKCSTRDFYKLIVQQVKENSYLYVFSMKPDGSTELLFPKAGNEYDERDMPIMTSGKVKVIIPEHPDRAFTTNQAGTDYLCILICKQRVENMLHQLKQIEQAHGELPDRIRQVFEHEVVAEEDVLYSNRRMKGEVRKSKGQILPIILKVDVQE